MAKILRAPLDTSGVMRTEVISCLQNGGVVAIPTESFYALAAVATNPLAVARVNTIKGRPKHKPILSLIGDRSQLRTLAKEVPSVADLLIRHFWPGPLTIIFPACSGLPEELTAGTGTIGIRQPAVRGLLTLLREIAPLTGTSANRSDEPPTCTAEEVEQTLGHELDLIIDEGPTAGGKPSTLVDLNDQIRVVREGPITHQQLKDVLTPAGFALTD